MDVCADFDDYRHYIESSKAEWTVAKNGYVQGQAGWFSGRSACYLAAGRPVIVQDTGFAQIIPTGEGVLTFQSIEEAAEAVQMINADYDRHAKSARSIAEEFFDSDRVLSRMIESAMNSDD
jgi:glycosyltransferase involved in cell wall biosynthesis